MKTSEIVAFSVLVVPTGATAHHAVAGSYDTSRTIEAEGVVTEVLWRNPHVQLSLRGRDENGRETVWELATTSLSNMRRWKIAPDFIEVGDEIRVAGNPAVRGEHGLYVRNVLTASGEEVLLGLNVQPRWSNRTIGMAESRRLGVGDTSAPELGLFRVWSTPDNIPVLIPRNFGHLPENRANLTTAAKAALDGFNWARDNPLRNCAPKGMPTIMEAPYPFELVRDGENILWHDEEYDTVRTFHMTSDTAAAQQAPSLLGYSVGRFEDERTLIVRTTKMGWGHFDGQGVRLSTDAETIERFELSALGDRLDYRMTVIDPATFIAPVVLEKHWVWYPDAAVGAYACSTEAED
jgi:Family of unknown function (DUF6152)